MVKRSGKSDRRNQRLGMRFEKYREADRCDDDTDVLDRRIREEPLHVRLHRREDNAEERGRESEREGDDAPPPKLAVQQIKRDPQKTVDRRLQHDAAHQRGDGRRRCRVRFGQPDVQREEPGFCAEAAEREKERDAGPAAGKDHRAHRTEGVVAAAALQNAKAKQDRDRADVSDQQVEKTGASNLGNPVVGRNEKERRKRHRFPGDHEEVRIVGDQHHRNRGEEDVVLKAKEPWGVAGAGAKITRRIKRDRGTRGTEQQQEERRQRVDADVKGKFGESERQDRRLRKRADRKEGYDRQRYTDRSARREQCEADEHEAARSHETERANRDPRTDRSENERERGRIHRRGGRSVPLPLRARDPVTDHLMRIPGCAPLSGASRNTPGPSPDAASTMPSERPNFILRGARLATIGVSRPMRSSGLYAALMPAKTVRWRPSPTSSVNLISLSAPSTCSALTM